MPPHRWATFVLPFLLASCQTAREGEPCQSEMGRQSGCSAELLCFHPEEGKPTCERKEKADETCRASDLCQERGGCTYSSKVARCVPEEDGDCAQSAICAAEGRCTRRRNACVVAKTVDCERSEACKNDGRCHARPDRAAGACVRRPASLP